MSQFIDSIREVKRNWKTYDAWEQNQADDASQRKYLSDKLDLPAYKVALTREKTKIVLRASDMLDKRSENNCEDAERTTGLLSMAVIMPLSFLPMALVKKLSIEKFKTVNRITNVAMWGSVLGFILWGNEKQKEASRIGRFQAKQHELKDIKNFVIYTPEQIAAAKIVAKNIPDKKDDKSISKLFADMKQMSQDKTAYKKWLKDKVKDEDELQKVLNTSFTPEQIEQGQEDKEIITNIVKDINLKAEEYSENMENAYDTMGYLSFLASVPLAFGLNKLINKISKKPSKLASIVSFASPFIVSLALLLQGATQQKKAAQVGRFKKSQEIFNNPEVLMNYTDEQMNKAQHIKAPKQKEGFFEGLLSDFKFFKTYLKDSSEYANHIKTKGKEEEKLLEALKHTSVSLKQMKDAKFLQEKTFMTFDKIDEMSQRYSEDTEAGTEIARQGVWLAWLGIVGGVGLILKSAWSKGKIPIHKIAKWVSGFAFEKNAPVRKTIAKACDLISNNKPLKDDITNSITDISALERISKNSDIQSLKKEIQQMPDLQSQFRKGPIARWFRNLVGEITKWGTKKIMRGQIINNKSLTPEAANKAIKAINEELGGFKNKKTIFYTILAGALPILAIITTPAYALSAWLTNIQKKAGKIGIMKAMNDLDNPQLYVNSENNK